jgi:hypothetical protein
LQHPAGAGSSKNHETPFREEISFEALRTDGVVLFLRIPAKRRCGIFMWRYFRHRKMPQHVFSFFPGLVEISEDQLKSSLLLLSFYFAGHNVPSINWLRRDGGV